MISQRPENQMERRLYRPTRETIFRRKQRMGPKIPLVLFLQNAHEHRELLPLLQPRRTHPSKARRRSRETGELSIRNGDGLLACQGQGREWCSPTYGSAHRLPLRGQFAPRKRLKQRTAWPVSRTIRPIAPGLARDVKIRAWAGEWKAAESLCRA